MIHISIHALREEGDIRSRNGGVDRGISIHALREEGDAGRFLRSTPAFGISIHALREEGDALCQLIYFIIEKFLSTPSARRATHCLSP